MSITSQGIHQMGRYRAPAPKSSPYITPQGQLQLSAELQSLWQRRAGVTRALTAAAAEGDRSENAEYIYRKKELREIDRRIRYLQKRLPELKVVSQKPTDGRRIFFGASVTWKTCRATRCVIESSVPTNLTPLAAGSASIHRWRRHC